MAKNVVVCCDGTWNTKDQTYPTNVSKLHDAIKDIPPDQQVEKYLTGVGTNDSFWDKFMGGFSGNGLEKKLEEAYRFVVQNYEPGDDLFLFGFSRGAYTARSLAGLIRNSGIVKNDDDGSIADAMELYRGREDDPNSQNARDFKSNNSHEPDIHFIGVWDTVGARGIPLRGLRFLVRWKYEFHDVRLSSRVKNAYQALAIDERRFSFRPAVWERSLTTDEQALAEQNVEQAWFAGCHTDVGGGRAVAGLSDLAFTWMLDRAANKGLLFDQAYVEQNFKPDAMSKKHPSRTGIYKLMVPHTRPIKGTRIAEGVHDAPLIRWEQDETYRPSNLKKWLEQHPAALDRV